MSPIPFRQVVRSLARSRGFTVVAIGSLALGLGANTALLSPLSAVVFRPLPFAEVDRLVDVSESTVEGLSTVLACYLPARRATRINPVDALRAD